MKRDNEIDRYIFGFEEFYSYLSGDYSRGKDGVNGVYLIAEMLCYYKTKVTSYLDKLNELYSIYDFAYNTHQSYTFEGTLEFAEMQETIFKIRGTGIMNLME